MINPANTIQREEQHNPLELFSHLLDTVMPIDMKEFELNEEQTTFMGLSEITDICQRPTCSQRYRNNIETYSFLRVDLPSKKSFCAAAGVFCAPRLNSCSGTF